jgi:hypothetical protein
LEVLIVIQPVERHTYSGGQHVPGIEAGINVQDANEAPNQQAGAHQQYQSYGRLRNHKPVVQTMLPATAGHTPATLA